MVNKNDIQTSPITLTERAATEIKALLEEQEKPNAALRVWVAGGGCSGLTYGMALDDGEPEETDEVFYHSDVKIFVDQLSLKYMVGSQVDFVEDSLGGGFKIENPNAVKTCGCGSSFAPGEETLEGLDTPTGGCGGCGGF